MWFIICSFPQLISVFCPLKDQETWDMEDPASVSFISFLLATRANILQPFMWRQSDRTDQILTSAAVNTGRVFSTITAHIYSKFAVGITCPKEMVFVTPSSTFGHFTMSKLSL